jgi:hypothetical protein
MSGWMPMYTAPQDGRPVWAKSGDMCTWVYWNGWTWAIAGAQPFPLMPESWLPPQEWTRPPQ